MNLLARASRKSAFFNRYADSRRLGQIVFIVHLPSPSVFVILDQPCSPCGDKTMRHCDSALLPSSFYSHFRWLIVIRATARFRVALMELLHFSSLVCILNVYNVCTLDFILCPCQPSRSEFDGHPSTPHTMVG